MQQFSRHLCNEQVDIEFVGGEGVSETILTEKHDGWVEITLNRPDRRNALNEEMHLALRAAIRTLPTTRTAAPSF
jgi:1,4-dihydroxy-2-naphthoyl-CoA synthase